MHMCHNHLSEWVHVCPKKKKSEFVYLYSICMTVCVHVCVRDYAHVCVCDYVHVCVHMCACLRTA